MKRFLTALVASMFLASGAYAAEGKGQAKTEGEPMKTEGAKGDAKTAKAKAGKSKSKDKGETEAAKTEGKAKETK